MNEFVNQAKKFIVMAIAEQSPSLGQGIFWPRLTLAMSRLPPPVNDAIPEALKVLQADGFFDANGGITEQGLSQVYGSPNERIQEAKKQIYEHFRAMQARVGYTINWRAFITLPQPQRDALVDAVKELQRDGLLDGNEALTQKGYDSIY